MVENVSNNMSKVKNIEVQPITTCSYKKKRVYNRYQFYYRGMERDGWIVCSVCVNINQSKRAHGRSF